MIHGPIFGFPIAVVAVILPIVVGCSAENRFGFGSDFDSDSVVEFGPVVQLEAICESI